MKDLFGYPVMATDGKAGKVKDILFGDRHWRVRYLDVETRVGFRLNLRYLSEEKTEEDQVTRRLIEAKDLGVPKLGLDGREIPTRLSVEEVSKCEGFGAHLPAEEKYEMEFRRFFRHAIYDERPFFGSLGYAGYMPPVTAYDHTEEEIRNHLDRMGEIAGEHLHSARSVIGYHAVGKNETLGMVGDLILDMENWRIAYLVLDTRHGIPSRKYLVDMESVTRLDWSSSSLMTKLKSEDLVSMRRYWAYDPVNKDETDHEYDYCGKPCLRSLMEDVF
ncbi:PRC-barrel domain-containing protein [Pelagicoccus sp. SDUM812005]|uniref:PRC-barrel domain-containing protein n=1 Tax=Pelagicoccus sp. SDUM812005 TaxID=3041257 RepID=UPI00280E268E|nr:PRC-barrel domain-containing protein [Pelagicoccus sp. SDUM812005]MDQ8179240.1 PRC-barrel domain-containing protein [Pelagicoccus sp. SDUM812005]